MNETNIYLLSPQTKSRHLKDDFGINYQFDSSRAMQTYRKGAKLSRRLFFSFTRLDLILIKVNQTSYHLNQQALVEEVLKFGAKQS